MGFGSDMRSGNILHDDGNFTANLDDDFPAMIAADSHLGDGVAGNSLDSGSQNTFASSSDPINALFDRDFAALVDHAENMEIPMQPDENEMYYDRRVVKTEPMEFDAAPTVVEVSPSPGSSDCQSPKPCIKMEVSFTLVMRAELTDFSTAKQHLLFGRLRLGISKLPIVQLKRFGEESREKSDRSICESGREAWRIARAQQRGEETVGEGEPDAAIALSTDAIAGTLAETHST